MVTPSNSNERMLGRVKWFNNKTGFGFITITDGEQSGTDIFVHHSNISVENEQYRYLVQGEYLEFELSFNSSDDHTTKAVNVSGIKGGKLMCETKNEFRIARDTHKTNNTPDMLSASIPRDRTHVVPTRQYRSRGSGPREGNIVQTRQVPFTNSTPALRSSGKYHVRDHRD